MAMTFVTLFTRLQNVHLLKDVGMIPYLLYRDYGIDSTIVSYKNENDYQYLTDKVKGLKLKFIKKTGNNPILPALKYVWTNAASIDVLNVYHLNLLSFLSLLIYKFKKKPDGIGYLKLDMDKRGYKRLFAFSPVGLVKRMTMSLADVISVETTILWKKLRKKYKDKIIYIPNGFYSEGKIPDREFNKENIILTVGNLGTYAKATDNLMQAFAGAAYDNDYRLVLVGPVEESFKGFIKAFMENHSDLKDRIIFTGAISDKDRLSQIYKKAKIFALPSRSESFGIVLLEAASKGDFLVTTGGVPAGIDINNDGKFGFVVPVDDVSALSGAFVRLMNSKADWNSRACEIADYTYYNFSWEPIVSKLHDVLEVKRGRK
ncbi:MAG: glycosyltransferase [Lachnospiraceae bacterium]|nr:glycosyltransferase [Lachnospiraceae bacterium]